MNQKAIKCSQLHYFNKVIEKVKLLIRFLNVICNLPNTDAVYGVNEVVC